MHIKGETSQDLNTSSSLTVMYHPQKPAELNRLGTIEVSRCVCVLEPGELAASNSQFYVILKYENEKLHEEGGEGRCFKQREQHMTSFGAARQERCFREPK